MARTEFGVRAGRKDEGILSRQQASMSSGELCWAVAISAFDFKEICLYGMWISRLSVDSWSPRTAIEEFYKVSAGKLGKLQVHLLKLSKKQCIYCGSPGRSSR